MQVSVAKLKCFRSVAQEKSANIFAFEGAGGRIVVIIGHGKTESSKMFSNRTHIVEAKCSLRV